MHKCTWDGIMGRPFAWEKARRSESIKYLPRWSNIVDLIAKNIPTSFFEIESILLHLIGSETLTTGLKYD